MNSVIVNASIKRGSQMAHLRTNLDRGNKLTEEFSVYVESG